MEPRRADPERTRRCCVKTGRLDAHDEAAFDVVRDLERLLLDSAELDKAGRYRAGSLASALRQHIGVH